LNLGVVNILILYFNVGERKKILKHYFKKDKLIIDNLSLKKLNLSSTKGLVRKSAS